MFEFLTDRIQDIARRLTGRTHLTDANIRDAVNELKKTLLAADVNYRVVKEFTKRVKEKAIGQKIARNISPGQAFMKIVYEELVHILGDHQSKINIEFKPAVILLAGIQGSGKTTFAAKLAKYIFENFKKLSLLVTTDTRRPAALIQLQTLAQKLNMPSFPESPEDLERGSAPDIALQGVETGKRLGVDVVILDTAGRQILQEELINELKQIRSLVKPSEVLYVIDATMGQDAINIATRFYKEIPFTGVVLTKLDSDARGGAALTVNYITGVPIKFVSTGEHLDDIELFDPKRFASRILGTGDIATLIEKLQKQISEEEAKTITRKLASDEYDMNDLLKQIRLVKKMGNWKSLLSLLPGASKALKNIPDEVFDKIKHVEAIILSMTPEERANPEIIDYSRKLRIARGSGRPLHEVNRLLKQYKQMKKLFKRLKQASGKRSAINPALLQNILR